MAKMTMAKHEKSAADRKADAAGKHGKEGSAKDVKADRAAVAKISKGRK
jgi:hypothetical protein